ncbi:hypothetical protein EW146_g515 [Bondarzewia mesenterica]|uniref:Ubiquinol-cytochrome C reductase hinge domain-containing protein n=1 Tax=Bondarzewia mesenterica TaxID=1095465 RepID=A0A4S4M748_9AGAM|nr:hypothetical protein EW146_g515 [Bondarzewia mesenterica]
MSLSSFLSSIVGVVHADAPEEKPQEGEPQEAEAAEAEEEEEPEDIHPQLREECQESAKCKPLTQHFLHCQEKVQAGEGYKGEDCVEEMCTCSSFFCCATCLLTGIISPSHTTCFFPSPYDALLRQLRCTKTLQQVAMNTLLVDIVLHLGYGVNALYLDFVNDKVFFRLMRRDRAEW